MQMAAFNAVCPYEIGDKVKVAIPAQGENGQMFSVEVATITDIACTHYVKKGKIVFTYELNHSGQYAQFMNLKDAAKRV
mgnify:FL=1